MTAASSPASARRRPFLVPTLTKQCWGFMIGSALFAAGSAPGLRTVLGTNGSNICFFVGAWFFTAAGLVQLFLSGPMMTRVPNPPGHTVRAEWLTAATQSFGTLLFNVSTSGALYAKTLSAQQHDVWSPDAGGSVAFLVSGVLAFAAYAQGGTRWSAADPAVWSVIINFLGCVAFAASAVGAFTLPDGTAVDGFLANSGTFVGALCFLVASLIVLPAWSGHPSDRPKGATPAASTA